MNFSEIMNQRDANYIREVANTLNKTNNRPTRNAEPEETSEIKMKKRRVSM